MASVGETPDARGTVAVQVESLSYEREHAPWATEAFDRRWCFFWSTRPQVWEARLWERVEGEGQAVAQGSGRENLRQDEGPAQRDDTKAATRRAECGRNGGENGERASQKRRRGPRETEAFSPRHALGK